MIAASHPKIAALTMAMNRSVSVARAVKEDRKEPAEPPVTMTLKK